MYRHVYMYIESDVKYDRHNCIRLQVNMTCIHIDMNIQSDVSMAHIRIHVHRADIHTYIHTRCDVDVIHIHMCACIGV